jgi:hypothetical protein
MIRIKVRVGSEVRQRERELYQAVEQHARVWKPGRARGQPAHLTFIHEAPNVKGRVREVKSDDPECLVFSCTGRTHTEEAITAGRFVHLVLRDLADVSDISLHRR